MRLSADERRRCELLEWLVGRGHGMHDVSPVYIDVDGAFRLSHEDVKDLEARSLVRAHFGGGGHITAEATSVGRSELERIRAERNDKNKRRWACRTALVQWLDDQGAVEGSRDVIWNGFFSDSRADFYGQTFNEEEVDHAAGWLRRQGFIDGLMVHERSGPIRSYLTDQGLECVERSDGDVRQYCHDREERAAGGTTLNVSGRQVQVAMGDGSSQVINSGADLKQLQEALRGLIDILRALDVVDDDHELEQLLEGAATDLDSEHPTGKPLNRFLDRIRAMAQTSGNIAVAATITTAVNALLSDAGHLIPGLIH